MNIELGFSLQQWIRVNYFPGSNATANSRFLTNALKELIEKDDVKATGPGRAQRFGLTAKCKKQMETDRELTEDTARRDRAIIK